MAAQARPSLSVWRAVLPATMGASLVLTLVLNLAACVALAQGASVVPFAQDEALIHLELWGFASTMVLAVSGRVPEVLAAPAQSRLVVPPRPHAVGAGEYRNTRGLGAA